MAGVCAEASAASSRDHRDPRGWRRDIEEANRVQRAARRECFKKESGGETSCGSGRAVPCTRTWEWSPLSGDLKTQVYSLAGLGKRHRDLCSDFEG